MATKSPSVISLKRLETAFDSGKGVDNGSFGLGNWKLLGMKRHGLFSGKVLVTFKINLCN